MSGSDPTWWRALTETCVESGFKFATSAATLSSDIPPRQPEHYGGGINFRLARGQTEFDDDVDVAGIGQIDRRFPLSLSEMLIVTLPCIIPFVDVKCSMAAWHT